MNNLFRKSALEKLSSPEQLDKTIVITSPMSWLALIGITIIIIAFITWTVTGTLPSSISAEGVIVGSESTLDIHSPYSGKILRYYINNGDSVSNGDKIADIEIAENNVVPLLAVQDGIVTEQFYQAGETVNKYDTILSLTPNCEKVLVCYIPADSGKEIAEGMKVLLTPSALDEQKVGHMEAEVIGVDDYVTSEDEVQRHLGENSKLSDTLISDSAVVSIVCDIKKSDTASGYYWNSQNANDIVITDGTNCSVKIITDESAPISKLFPARNAED